MLELEAAVQRNPRDHEAWYHLGLKQQENEREDQAIRALRRVVNLEPEYRAAYLALAVSLTNEGDREGANQMLEKWIEMGEGAGLAGTAREGGGRSRENWISGQKRLVGRLIDMARKSPEEVDAEVQIALGVLFNATEVSSCNLGRLLRANLLGVQQGGRLFLGCFVCPAGCESACQHAVPKRGRQANHQDWLLYNRLGATLANGGRSNEAIAYYHKALALHPTFVRAL